MFSWSHKQQGELKNLSVSGNTMREYETGFPANREFERQVMHDLSSGFFVGQEANLMKLSGNVDVFWYQYS